MDTDKLKKKVLKLQTLEIITYNIGVFLFAAFIGALVCSHETVFQLVCLMLFFLSVAQVFTLKNLKELVLDIANEEERKRGKSNE